MAAHGLRRPPESGLGAALSFRAIRDFVAKDRLQTVVAAGAVALLVELLVIFVQRLVYPFEIEWMEGGTVAHLQILRAGEPLYREPSLAFTPYLYPPFYYYVSGAVARVVGIGLFAPRLVSVCSTIGSMVLVGRLVRAEGGRPIAVLVALSFFAVSFQRSGYFMDLARVDSFFLFLTLLGLYTLRMGQGTRSAILAGLIFSLAFFTKQTGLLLGGAILAGALPSMRRRAIAAGGSFAISAIVAVLVNDWLTAGWFRYYVFTVPGAHPLRWSAWWDFLRGTAWEPLPVVLLFALAAFVTGAFRERRGWMYAGLCAGAFVGGYSSLMKQNGFINGIMPWLVSLSLVAGMGMEMAARAAESQRRWFHLALGVVVIQWVVVQYSPRQQVPSKRDYRAGAAMIERLRRQPGPVLALSAGWYTNMAGHPEMTAHTMALVDVFDQKDPARTAKLAGEIRDAIKSHRYATIVTDDATSFLPEGIPELIRANYHRQESAFDGPDGARTKVGTLNRPIAFWRPN